MVLEYISFEMIDRVQDILSIPIAGFIVYQLIMIRRKLNEKEGKKRT